MCTIALRFVSTTMGGAAWGGWSEAISPSAPFTASHSNSRPRKLVSRVLLTQTKFHQSVEVKNNLARVKGILDAEIFREVILRNPAESEPVNLQQE